MPIFNRLYSYLQQFQVQLKRGGGRPLYTNWSPKLLIAIQTPNSLPLPLKTYNLRMPIWTFNFELDQRRVRPKDNLAGCKKKIYLSSTR